MATIVEELWKIVENVHLDYEYCPAKSDTVHKVKCSNSKRNFLGDESCKSNIIGKDNEKIGRLFCCASE